MARSKKHVRGTVYRPGSAPSFVFKTRAREWGVNKRDICEGLADVRSLSPRAYICLLDGGDFLDLELRFVLWFLWQVGEG